MEAAKFKLPTADIIAYNSEGQMVLIAEVKGTALKNGGPKKQAISQLRWYLQTANTVIPFVMLADIEDIEIFQGNDADLLEPISSIKTADVLSHYDPEFGKKRIFEPYLKTLVEAWLRDLAYHWKSEKPPASEQLADIGLSQRLAGGTTEAGIAFGSDTLH